jgi:ribonuclease HI
LSVVVTSSAEHCECRTRVRQVCSRTVCSDVPDDDTERLRAELEGIGIGFEDFEQQAARFQSLAADPCVDLVGFSDGSLSGDGNNGGYSWIVAVVENGAIQEGGVLAGGGGAALASDNTNVLLSSTRMEALGFAAGMSYARNWVGKVDWYIDNTGVINNFRRMHRWVANDWSKAGDRDVNG